MSAEYDLNLQDYLRILRRRWKIVAGCCLALGGLTLLLTPRVRAVYEASARVKWSRTDSITGLFLEAFTWSPGDDLATQAQIITSRPVALKAAQRLGRIPASATIDSVLADKDLSKALEAMLASYTAKPIDNTSLIEIRSACASPDEAVRLVNAVMEEYIVQHTFERNRQAIEAREFVERQVAEVSGRLRAAKERLTRFKEANVGASMPDAKEIQYFQDEAGRDGGWSVEGIEYSPEGARRSSQRLGRPVAVGDLAASAGLRGPFDVVTLWHVLEHLVSPAQVLEAVRLRLRLGGLVAVAVPNLDNLPMRAAYRLARGRPLPLYERGAREPHLSHFSPGSLFGFLRRVGFERIEIRADRCALTPAKRAIDAAAAFLSLLTGRLLTEAMLAFARRPQ